MKVLQVAVCMIIFVFGIYSYLNVHNEVTHLKMQLPAVEKEIALIQEGNRRLSYEMEQFENPSHLIELAHSPEYAHLKHPLIKEVLTVPEAFASNSP